VEFGLVELSGEAGIGVLTRVVRGQKDGKMVNRPVRYLGLTGVMGGGKSTACAVFAGLGWKVFSADACVAELLRSDPEVRGALRERFGHSVFLADGMLDRRRLADIVFEDDDALRWLEALLHPKVMRQVEAAKESGRGGQRWVFEIPLLFEKNLETYFDATVTVSCDPATQRARLRAKGFQVTDIERRIPKQLPNSIKMQRADFVLTNAGCSAFLEAQALLLSSQMD
jgi:dephospho-CoA kinase